MFIDLLSISCSCLIWEKFGFPILRSLFKVLKKVGKPFTCAPCLSLWISVYYLRHDNIFIATIVYFVTIFISYSYDRTTVRKINP